MAKLNIVQAVNSALKEEMERDPDVVVLGEDVGRNGGVFRATEDLWEKWGDSRVMDTPIAESGITGFAIGMAVAGFKPVVEIQFDGFILPALDQMISHAARIRWRSRGRYHVPMVMRAPYGGGIKALEHHSDSPESHFIHAPGLKVVIPSTPTDAKGLLISSIRDPDPVVFLEPKRIYRAIKEEVPEGDFAIPIGEAKIAMEGEDVTVIAWGAMVREAIGGAKAALEEGISAEVIDLRTLSPVDTNTIIKSVSKTGRVVIVHEAPKTLGFGAELLSLINEKAFLSLEAPIERITGFDTIVPLPKLEHHYFPNAERIKKGILKVANF